jgi:hypothetical protein
LLAELEYQQEQYPPPPPSSPPTHAPVDEKAISQLTSTVTLLGARVETLESFCKLSGLPPSPSLPVTRSTTDSRSVRSVQDLVNAFRGARHQTSKLEERLQQLTLRQQSQHPAEPRPFAPPSVPTGEEGRVSERLRQIKSFVKHLTSRCRASTDHLTSSSPRLSSFFRLEACEVVDQVHQVRLDGLEEWCASASPLISLMLPPSIPPQSPESPHETRAGAAESQERSQQERDHQRTLVLSESVSSSLLLSHTSSLRLSEETGEAIAPLSAL